MKPLKTQSSAVLCLILAALASCNGQSTPHVGDAAAQLSTTQPSTLARGTTVPELDPAIWFIFQDSSKNHWFGSPEQGLYRHDGKTLTRFTTEDGLPDNHIGGIQQDKAGNIYIDTGKGISKFDGRTFTTLTPVKTEEWRLQADDLWFRGKGSDSGPYRYDGTTLYQLTFPKSPQEDEFYSKNPRMPWSAYGIYTIYRDSRGHMWFGTACLGACRFDGKTLTWLYEDHLTTAPNGGSFGIRSIIEDKAGKFWICNTRYRYSVFPHEPSDEAGRVRYTKEVGVPGFKPADGIDVYYQAIVEDKDNLWMSTYGDGVWRYDGQKMTRYPVRNGEADITVFSIYKDRDGVLWLGTQGNGAYRFNGERFEKWKP